MKFFKKLKIESKGITLISLIVTIIVLLILASISIGVLTGDNGLLQNAGNAKDITEISNEKEIVELASVQAMGHNKRGVITKARLQTELDNSTGKGVTDVTEEKAESILLAEFIESKRIYEVDKDGNVEYLGNRTELAGKATITADPDKGEEAKLYYNVELTVKTPLAIENTENAVTLVYAWNKSNTEKPTDNEYKGNTLTLTSISSRIKKGIVSSNITAAGQYYLWAKVLIGEAKTEEVCFGPYMIKDHDTLMAVSSANAEEKFLENKNVEVSKSVPRNKIESIKISDTIGEHTLSDDNCWDVSSKQNGKYLAWHEDEDEDGYYEVTIAGEGGVVANTDSTNLFKNIGCDSNITTEVTITGLENLDTGLVTNMDYMFENCKNTKNLDLSKFDTGNVTNMKWMFDGCSSLTSIDVSKFDTENVTSMQGMFSGCSLLSTLDISKFNTNNLKSMSSMFYRCSGLTSLDVSKFNTENVTFMYWTFNGCNNLESLDVSKFNTGNVTNMEGMFRGCSLLSTLDVSKWNTKNVTNMQNMFSGCNKLTVLDVSKFDTGKVTNMRDVFSDCSLLSTLDVSKWNTGNVTNMRGMFNGCSLLSTLDVSEWNTGKVTNMRDMFCDCSLLSTLDVSKWNTENVTSLWGTFQGCKNLKILDVSKWNTGKVEWMGSYASYSYGGTFDDCSSLTELDVSKWDTSSAISMARMFRGCSSLTNINVTNFNTSNVTDMGIMFSKCSGLESLDLTSFNTSNATDMRGMFHSDTNLTKIYVNKSKWIIGENTNTSNMFLNCGTSEVTEKE